MARAKQFIIDESTVGELVYPPGMGRGYEPSRVIPFMLAPPSQIPMIPETDWEEMIKERKKYKTGLREFLRTGKIGQVKDQNGQGYCWMYSVTRTVEYVRALQGQKYTALSAHSAACKVKNFRDEGAWCGLGAQFIRANGVVPESLWPAKAMSRTYDTPENWAEASKYRITEDFVDLTRQVWDQNLGPTPQDAFKAAVSCLLQNIPCALDFNWWAHSVCGVDVDLLDGEVVIDIDNSWTPTWGDKGTGKLRGSRKYPDGAVATRVVEPA